MATLPSERIQSAVLAVLRAAKDAGLGSITRTVLVKFVYLLDCLHAEDHGGETASRAGWYFDKFGPFAVDLVAGVDAMVSASVIQSQQGEGRERDFMLYWLGEFPRGPALADTGLSVGKAGRFEKWIRKYSHDLQKLLDFVYFHTEPMDGALPGRPLSFDSLAAAASAARYEPVHVADHSRLYRLLELSNKLSQKYEASAVAQKKELPFEPIYDEVYARAMRIFDDEEAVEDLRP